MEKHINIVGILHIIMGALGILTGLLIYTILHLIGDFSDDAQANMVLSIVANVLAAIMIICSIPGIIGGVGVMKRKQWGRILILIISILNLINFPFGTALGVYSIWALVQPEITAEFERKPQQPIVH
ncbi:hypothetical protein [Gaoshiqia sediminis]|uniref:DUF4064 domain-containing protein n=1 Tax=Gaoshiqia sediminis TaxID=2986998 RepID=A0AA41Y910_9BACT|nr:hypothetical protein [Gaoshiqia sediminis]MCW0483442.1 hypothetical protein [Gaoshiqia sediminis]